MDYQQERLGLIVDLAEQSMDIVQRFSNDPIEAGNIQTASGPIKNLKQVSADIKSDGEAAIDVAVTELIDTLKTETSVSALIDGLTNTAALAKASADRSESASAMAAAASNPFPTKADGLVATSGSGPVDRFFSVPATGAALTTLYRNDAGVATVIGESPSAELVSSFRPDIYDQSGRAPLLRNLFDLTRTTDGFYIDTVGGTTASALYYISDYIPVKEGQQYVFAATVALAFYDSVKGFISHFSNQLAGNAFTAPPATQYVRFSQPLSTKKAKQMLIKGSVLPASYIGFGFTDPATQAKKTHVAARALINGMASGPVNLFDPSRATDDTALSTDGGTYAQAGYFVSHLIPIDPSTSYITNRGSNPTCFYDADKQKIANIITASGTPFVSHADACYIRFQAQPLTQKSTVMLIEGTVLPASYVAFGAPTNASVSKTALEAARSVAYGAQPLVRNVFDMNRAKLDTGISAVNGGTSAASGYFVTGKLPVNPGDTFVSTFGPNNLCFYDASGAFLSGSTAYNGSANLPIAVPAGAYFIQFQVAPLTRLQSLMVTQGSAVPAGYLPFGGLTSKLPWQDKKLVILGDSISATGLYIPALVAGTGMSLLANHAVAGRAVRDMGKTTAGIVLQASDLTSADVVSILAATNDYGGGRALGTLADAYAGSVVASFYNDVYQLLTLLYTLKPTIRVVFSTPLKRGAFEGQPVYPAANSAGAKLDQYVAAIIEVCGLFSVPVCNLFRDGGFNLLNLSVNTGDNLHPNAAGAALHVRPMIAAINAC